MNAPSKPRRNERTKYAWNPQGVNVEDDRVGDRSHVTIDYLADLYGIDPNTIAARARKMRRDTNMPIDHCLPHCLHQSLAETQKLSSLIDAGGVRMVTPRECYEFAIKLRSQIIAERVPSGKYLRQYTHFMRLLNRICRAKGFGEMKYAQPKQRGECVKEAYRMIAKQAREDKKNQ